MARGWSGSGRLAAGLPAWRRGRAESCCFTAAAKSCWAKRWTRPLASRRWKVSFDTRYVSSISSDDGPRCVPVIQEGRVFLVGPKGELQCVDLETGKKNWYRDLAQEFKAPDGYFGAGSSPIVEGGKLLINVGGSGGAGIVALSPADGHTLWKATDEAASYSSPVAATVDGVRHVLFVTRLNVVSVDPQSGAVRFRFPFGGAGRRSTRPIHSCWVIMSSSGKLRGGGPMGRKIGASRATKVWANDDVMSSQYATCVEHDGMLYGIDGRQDVGTARLRCFNPRDGKVQWTEEGFGTGTLIAADGLLLVMKTDGELVLVEPSPRAFRSLARAKLLPDTVQALPALADGLLFARDTGTLKCFVVGRSSARSCAKAAN